MHAHDDYPKGNQRALHVHSDAMCVVPTESHSSWLSHHILDPWDQVEDGYHRITVLAWLLRYVIFRVPLSVYVWITRSYVCISHTLCGIMTQIGDSTHFHDIAEILRIMDPGHDLEIHHVMSWYPEIMDFRISRSWWDWSEMTKSWHMSSYVCYIAWEYRLMAACRISLLHVMTHLCHICHLCDGMTWRSRPLGHDPRWSSLYQHETMDLRSDLPMWYRGDYAHMWYIM